MDSHLTNGTMDNIIVVRKIPKKAKATTEDKSEESKDYSTSWVVTRLFELLVHH